MSNMINSTEQDGTNKFHRERGQCKALVLKSTVMDTFTSVCGHNAAERDRLPAVRQGPSAFNQQLPYRELGHYGIFKVPLKITKKTIKCKQMTSYILQVV